jgi:hypothetical protein
LLRRLFIGAYALPPALAVLIKLNPINPASKFCQGKAAFLAGPGLFAGFSFLAILANAAPIRRCGRRASVLVGNNHHLTGLKPLPMFYLEFPGLPVLAVNFQGLPPQFRYASRGRRVKP